MCIYICDICAHTCAYTYLRLHYQWVSSKASRYLFDVDRGKPWVWLARHDMLEFVAKEARRSHCYRRFLVPSYCQGSVGTGCSLRARNGDWGGPPRGSRAACPIPPPQPGSRTVEGALETAEGLGTGHLPGDGLLVQAGPWSQGWAWLCRAQGWAGLWGGGDQPRWGVAGAWERQPWRADMASWAMGRGLGEAPGETRDSQVWQCPRGPGSCLKRTDFIQLVPILMKRPVDCE